LEFRVDGFSHKLPVLAARLFGVVGGAGAGSLAAASFGTVKEALCRTYRNMNMQV
jgi:hypothetical protein